MNNSVSSNIYAFDSMRVLEKYQGHVNGDPNCVVVVLSSSPLGEGAVNAIEKSCEKVGFGRGACAWACVDMMPDAGDDVSGGGRDSSSEHENGCELDAFEVLELIEGIDPISVVVTDSQAAKAICAAYGEEVVCDELNRVNGRTVAAFANFEQMLGSDEGKQAAWHLLKRL